jgi:hypothetical protein
MVRDLLVMKTAELSRDFSSPYDFSSACIVPTLAPSNFVPEQMDEGFERWKILGVLFFGPNPTTRISKNHDRCRPDLRRVNPLAITGAALHCCLSTWNI